MDKKYEVKVSNGNTKLGHAIPNINMPVGITCNPNAPCFKGCYAKRGHFLYKNVKDCLWNNYMAYKENPTRFFESIAFKTSLNMYVRWHSSGDIVDEQYLAGMCWVARKNPKTHYLAFTKQYEIVNNYCKAKHRIPKNLHIVFSCWKNWIPENPFNFPTTWVYFPKDEDNTNRYIPKKAFPCSGKCATCQKCWGLKKGESVVFKKH